MRCEECHELLGPYVDGELMAEEQDALRDHLASCRACSAEYDALSALSRRLRSTLERPAAPDVLKARIRSAVARMDTDVAEETPRRRTSRNLIAAAAAVLVLAATGALSFAAGRRSEALASTSQQVLASHIRSLMPGHLTDVASTDQHNVKPWFNGRLDLSPAVPRLDSAGFPLIGGRLDYVDGRPVASVVYGRRQHIINVFSWPATGQGGAARTTSIANGYHVVHWQSGGQEFWAVSDVSELDAFVALFAKAMSP